MDSTPSSEDFYGGGYALLTDIPDDGAYSLPSDVFNLRSPIGVDEETVPTIEEMFNEIDKHMEEEKRKNDPLPVKTWPVNTFSPCISQVYPQTESSVQQQLNYIEARIHALMTNMSALSDTASFNSECFKVVFECFSLLFLIMNSLDVKIANLVSALDKQQNSTTETTDTPQRPPRRSNRKVTTRKPT